MISVGGIAVSTIGRDSEKGFAPLRITTFDPDALMALLPA